MNTDVNRCGLFCSVINRNQKFCLFKPLIESICNGHLEKFSLLNSVLVLGYITAASAKQVG